MGDPGNPKRRLAAILSADVAGYSRLMAGDEDATIATLGEYRSAITALVGDHGGRLVDFTGDNFLSEFASAVDAVRCAVAIQQALRPRNASLPDGRRMQFRIGIHLGDVRVEGERIFGDGVNIAARLEGLAEPGGICISSNVHDLVRGKLDLRYQDLGDREVKNIPHPVHAIAVVTDGVESAPRSPRRRWRATRALALAMTVVAVVGLGTLWHGRQDALDLPKGPSIATLPFENLSGDPSQDYFSDGLTEDIITNLSKFRELFVIARHSTFQYKGRHVDVRDVGHELGARYVLEGSVRRAGDRVRITAQLSDASDAHQLWADTYDRDLTAGDLFAVQDDVTQRVVNAIGGRYGPISLTGLAETRRKATHSLDAYDCVLRTYEYLQIHTAENHLAARTCLEHAVEIDPQYAETRAWLAYTYAEEYRHGWNARPGYDPSERALEIATRAVELDPTSQVARGVLATTHFDRHEDQLFKTEAEQAIALNPNNALWLEILGGNLVQLGDWDRGMAMVRKAIALDPNPPGWVRIIVFLDQYRRGQYAQALAGAQATDIEDLFGRDVFVASAYGQLGRRAEAREAIDKLRAQYPDFPNGIYDTLVKQYRYPEGVARQVVEGLRKAGAGQ